MSNGITKETHPVTGAGYGSDKPAGFESETVPVTTPRRRGIKGHCARFWWAHLIVLICVVVLVVCLVIFVGVPHIAQGVIDGATLHVDGIRVSNTQTNNFTMSINSSLTTGGSAASATIDPFVGIMYLEDKLPHNSFASLQFPSLTSATLQVVNVTDYFVSITDMDALTDFNTWLLHNETLRITVAGTSTVHVHGISRGFGVSITKTVTIPGLNGFAGFQVTNTSVGLGADANGNDFYATTIIPNPSAVTFEVGNVTFNNYLDGTLIGNSTLLDVNLVAGVNNSITTVGQINETLVLAALGQSPYCSNGGVMDFVLQAVDVVNVGQVIPSYRDAMSTLNQTATVPVGADLKSQFGYTLTCSA